MHVGGSERSITIIQSFHHIHFQTVMSRYTHTHTSNQLLPVPPHQQCPIPACCVELLLFVPIDRWVGSLDRWVVSLDRWVATIDREEMAALRTSSVQSGSITNETPKYTHKHSLHHQGHMHLDTRTSTNQPIYKHTHSNLDTHTHTPPQYTHTHHHHSHPRTCPRRTHGPDGPGALSASRACSPAVHVCTYTHMPVSYMCIAAVYT